MAVSGELVNLMSFHEELEFWSITTLVGEKSAEALYRVEIISSRIKVATQTCSLEGRYKKPEAGQILVG